MTEHEKEQAASAVSRAEKAERLARFFCSVLEVLGIDATTECGICLEAMSDLVEAVAVLPCGHPFHETCWKEIAKRKQLLAPACTLGREPAVSLRRVQMVTRAERERQRSTDADEVRRGFGPKVATTLRAQGGGADCSAAPSRKGGGLLPPGFCRRAAGEGHGECTGTLSFRRISASGKEESQPPQRAQRLSRGSGAGRSPPLEVCRPCCSTRCSTTCR